MHLLWTFPPYATHFNTKVKKEKKKKKPAQDWRECEAEDPNLYVHSCIS